MDLEELARQIHADNKAAGWWDGWYSVYDRHDVAMCLVITEFAEAAEGARRELLDDKLPQYLMFHVEIADAMIRLLDLAGAYEIENLEDRVFPSIPTHERNMKHMDNPLAMIWYATRTMAQGDDPHSEVVIGLAASLAVAGRAQSPIWRIIEEKREFNKTRLDHKRESREAPGGKKW